MTNTDPILTALEAIRKDISVLRSEQEKQGKAVERLEQRQIQTDTSTAQLHTAIAQNTSMMEALREGQESSTAAIRADIQDLASKMARNKKEIDIRLDSLDEHTSHHNPIKH